jgi:Flp pilus assembly protein TadB
LLQQQAPFSILGFLKTPYGIMISKRSMHPMLYCFCISVTLCNVKQLLIGILDRLSHFFGMSCIFLMCAVWLRLTTHTVFLAVFGLLAVFVLPQLKVDPEEYEEMMKQVQPGSSSSAVASPAQRRRN